jgi:hypothetical protein
VSADAFPGPTVDIAYREVRQSLEEGIALVDADLWEILFENAKFFTWFPSDEDDDYQKLNKRVAELNADRAAARLEVRRNYSFDIPSEKRGRQEPLRIFPGRDSCYLIEVQNVSKELETQYMLTPTRSCPSATRTNWSGRKGERRSCFSTSCLGRCSRRSRNTGQPRRRDSSPFRS